MNILIYTTLLNFIHIPIIRMVTAFLCGICNRTLHLELYASWFADDDLLPIAQMLPITLDYLDVEEK